MRAQSAALGIAAAAAFSSASFTNFAAGEYSAGGFAVGYAGSIVALGLPALRERVAA